MAFVIGWNLILEYVIGASSVASGFSTYCDSLMGNIMQKTFRYYFPIDIEGFADYPGIGLKIIPKIFINQL